MARFRRVRGPIWEGLWPDLGGSVARFGRARGPIWESPWPDLGGLVARFGRVILVAMLLCSCCDCLLVDAVDAVMVKGKL